MNHNYDEDEIHRDKRSGAKAGAIIILCVFITLATIAGVIIF